MRYRLEREREGETHTHRVVLSGCHSNGGVKICITTAWRARERERQEKREKENEREKPPRERSGFNKQQEEGEHMEKYMDQQKPRPAQTAEIKTSAGRWRRLFPRMEINACLC